MRISAIFVAQLSLMGSILHASHSLRAAPIDVPSDPQLASSPSAETLPPRFGEALDAFRAGELTKVLSILEAARREQPDLPPAEIMLATMFLSDEQVDRGRIALEDAAVKHPADPEPHLIFGDLAFRQRRFSDAQVQYERGVRLIKDFAGSPQRKRQLEIRALVGLAGVAESRRQYDESELKLKGVLALDSRHANAHFRLGNVLFAQDRPDEALAELRTAAELLESAPSPMLTLAELFRQAGNNSKAEFWIERAVEESPRDVRTQLAMAHWQLEVRNAPEAALPFAERAAELSAESFEAKLLRGIIAWALGHQSEAQGILEPLALQQPSNAQVNAYLAVVLAEQDDGDRRRAWELAKLTASGHPKSPEAFAAAGWIAYQRGDLALAEHYLQNAAAGSSPSRDARYYLARILFRRGQLSKAQQVLQQALTAEGLFIHLREALQWQQEIGKPSA